MFINQNFKKKKKANIIYQIKHLGKLIIETKNKGLLIKDWLLIVGHFYFPTTALKIFIFVLN